MALDQGLNSSTLSTVNRRADRWIGWSSPTWPWCKLNTDGACKKNETSSAER